MDLEKEISKLQSYQLCRAFEEIKSWNKTGILVDGLVRKHAEDFAKAMKQEDFKFLMVTREAFLQEMAKRFYESTKF